MIKFLVLQIRRGKLTLEEVPEQYRDEVTQALADSE